VLRKVDSLRKRVVSVGKEHASLCAKVSLVIYIWFWSIPWMGNSVVVMLLESIICTDMYEVLVARLGILYVRSWYEYQFVLVEGMKSCLHNDMILWYLNFRRRDLYMICVVFIASSLK